MGGVIVNYLSVYFAVAAEYRQARTGSSTAYFLADSASYFIAAGYFSCHVNCLFLILKKLFSCSSRGSGFTCLAAKNFFPVFNTFSFVWFRFSYSTNFSRHLPKQLLVSAFQRNNGVLPFFLSGGNFYFFRQNE